MTLPAAHSEPSSRAAHPMVSQLPGGRGEVGFASLTSFRQAITAGALPAEVAARLSR